MLFNELPLNKPKQKYENVIIDHRHEITTLFHFPLSLLFIIIPTCHLML